MKTNTVLRFMLSYWALGVVAAICFKQGGTDAAHRLLYFAGGNVLGISSTWCLMQVYARINANLALLITGSIAFILTQFAFWLLYRAQLTVVQWLGIAIVMLGMLLAAWRRRPENAGAQVVSADEKGTA